MLKYVCQRHYNETNSLNELEASLAWRRLLSQCSLSLSTQLA